MNRFTLFKNNLKPYRFQRAIETKKTSKLLARNYEQTKEYKKNVIKSYGDETNNYIFKSYEDLFQNEQ